MDPDIVRSSYIPLILDALLMYLNGVSLTFLSTIVHTIFRKTRLDILIFSVCLNRFVCIHRVNSGSIQAVYRAKVNLVGLRNGVCMGAFVLFGEPCSGGVWDGIGCQHMQKDKVR